MCGRGQLTAVNRGGELRQARFFERMPQPDEQQRRYADWYAREKESQYARISHGSHAVRSRGSRGSFTRFSYEVHGFTGFWTNARYQIIVSNLGNHGEPVNPVNELRERTREPGSRTA